MSQNVLFKIGTRAQYDALATYNQNTLYWLSDTQQLYKGDILFGTGAMASETAAGLLSAEDYQQLQELIKSGAAIDLTPVNGSIVITDKKIGVGLSAVEGNILSVKEDGLFAAVDTKPIENRLTAVEGSLAIVTKDIDDIKEEIAGIKESLVGGIHYRGSVATKDELPENPQQGDLYECADTGVEYCWNGTEWFEYGTSHFVPVAGAGIIVNGSEISVKIADNAHGLVAVEGGLIINLATAEQDGAMSKEDKAKIDAIPEVYVAKKYEVTDAPVGTLVNYGEKEIRIMCPDDAEYNLQNVGAGGDPNTYYVTFNTYCPSDDAVGYIEHLGGQSDAEILTDIKVDKYGRRYQPTWLAIAKYDAESNTWTYYGKNSSTTHYLGWDYRIDWYNADGKMIVSDSIRINLSNKDCHFASKPYYMNSYVTDEELDKAVQNMSEAYSWSEM